MGRKLPFRGACGGDAESSPAEQEREPKTFPFGSKRAGSLGRIGNVQRLSRLLSWNLLSPCASMSRDAGPRGR